MKRILAALSIALFFSTTVISQEFVMIDNNNQTIQTCGGDFSLGAYTSGTTYTMTICSDDPIDRHIRVFIASHNFPNGTELCVYDGPDTNAPLLVCWNSGTTSGSVAAQAQNTNSSGCLTFEFTSTTTGASWSGEFFCEFICQAPMLVDIVASSPDFTNVGGVDYVDVCWDEQNNQSFDVTFTAAGTYPPNTGYPLDDSNVTFTWDFNDGSPVQSGVGLTSVTHNFPERQGYTVVLNIEDSQGCINTNSVTQRVRVSRAPIWDSQSTFVSPTEICMGEQVQMCVEGYTTEEWNSSVIPAIADTTHLPDGTGVCYETDLMQNQFLPGQVLESVDDLNAICMNLVHTYIGDLTIYIQCPNGQSVQMQAQGGGSTNLGEPPPFIGNDPGTGYWYCITPDANQTMAQAASGFFVTTLPAGDYASYESLEGLVGCPLNGLWTITICDNWAIDEGYIFGWYIDFDESLFPEMWSYTPQYSPLEWTGLYGSQIQPPGNQDCATGTYITTGTPEVNSEQPFTFTLEDDFGCFHDTTMYVTVFSADDPNCCIYPNPTAGNDDEVCSSSYQLNASAPAPENNGFWTMISGPGNAVFANETLNNTTVTVNQFGEYVFEWTEQYLGTTDCANSDQVTIIFNESFDPTLTPVNDMCISVAPIQINAVDYGSQIGGNTTASPVPQALSANHIFNPAIAGPGTHTITNTVFDPCTGSNITDQITFEVFGEIQVANFTDQECIMGTISYFIIEYDVLDYNGNPAGAFMLNGATSTQSSFYQEIESPGFYGYTITDFNGCSEVVIDGYRDCGCPLYAGTMGSTQLQILCADECTDEVVTHNNDQQDADGAAIFEFMIHTGDNVPLAYSSTTNFCSYQIPGFQFNTTYYVSAIVGYDNGSGHPHITPPGCYSVALGTPVMWMQNPTAYAGPNKDTCGMVIQLNGNTPEPGMYGYWSSECSFFAVSGTSYTDPNAIVLASDYDDCVFTWNIVNGECVASDNVLIRFMQTPSPYAGENQTVCGNCVELEATPSVGGNISWSGSGVNFSNQNSAQTTACVDIYGTYQFFARENNGACYGTDDVLVTFVREPSPTIATATDTVCGVQYQLSVMNVQNNGFWTAYYQGEPLSPAPLYQPSHTSPNALVTIGNFTGLTRQIEFVWTETNQSSGVQCSGTASQTVVFARKPEASVGANDQAEVCGTSFTFSGDVTGSEWAVGLWSSSKVPSSFENQYDPFTTATLTQVPASFGDSAHVEVPYFWIMQNPDALSCVSMDTMWVTYYRRPNANAGIDNAICGNDYGLGAVYSLPHTDSYTPSGLWSVHQRPIPTASANIYPQHGDSVHVTVSDYGVWQFLFRENNSNATFCYDTDTVTIEFVEIPIVDAGPDKNVCGQCTNMEATSPGFSGSWIPSGQSFPDNDFDNPTAYICVNNYGPRDFVWQESNMAETSTTACTSQDTVTITFYRVPDPEILTDAADSTTCGLRFNNLRARNPGSGLTGVWWNQTDPDAVYGEPNHWNTYVDVTTYGHHDFYWIVSNGPTYQPDFCIDTAGPLTIHFIEIPNADAGGDTLFCGFSGSLNANPSVGTGVWSTPSSQLITFENPNDPNSGINSQVLTGSANPYFNIIWTEDNTNGCTDRDTIKVRFARIPNSEINIVPPKCFGEPATISAKEDSLQHYSWNFYSGIIDSIAPENSQGGLYEHFVYWTNQDTSHNVSLIATNYWGCQSLITMDTVFEPPIPEFDVIIINDTCMLDRGGIIFEDTLSTNAFYWLDSTVGPTPGTPITAVYNLPTGEYPIRARYRTVNQQWYNYYIQTFGSANCTDTIYFEIEPIGLMEALFEIPPYILDGELVAPEAEVIFNNLSDYAGVRRRCIWHFGDGNTLTSCDEQVEHIYTEAGCYEPFLIIMNRDLQECRDTAFIDVCIQIDNQSDLEVPNIFTPNGDGINDFFQVKAQTLRTFNGYIVNRWGTVVYEWTNWQDEEAGWDGKLPGGSNASSGVYYYIIKAVGMDDVEYEERGALHLMR